MRKLKIEAFGFTPVMGQEYVITFTKDNELLSTLIYNGSPLPPMTFPDNAKIGMSITDKATGKHLMSSEFVAYNGKLYKSVFNLPLKNENTNKNANVYIKDVHYDLTTGSVLVQVQGFAGDKYQLNVSDSTLKHKTASMPIELQDDMYYSIPTELVQGNTFDVTLQDEHGKSVDLQQFTAPISTDWRFTDTVEDGSLILDENGDGVPDTPQNQEELEAQQNPAPHLDPSLSINQQSEEGLQTEAQTAVSPEAEDGNKTKDMIVIGAVSLAALLLLILVIRMLKRWKAKREWSRSVHTDPEDNEEENEENDEEDEPAFEDLAPEEDSEKTKK